MKQQVVAALDIGTKSIKLAVAAVTDEGTLDVLSTVEEPAFGVRKGVVAHSQDVAKHIASLVSKAEQLTSHTIEEVSCSIGGSRLFCVPSHGLVAVSRADSQISQEDVDRVLLGAQTFSLSRNQEILDVYPVQYIVDGEPGIKEPIGMKAVRLEVDVLAVCLFSPDLKNLTEAVLEAGLEITGIHPGPVVAASAVLTPQQKERGVAVVDLGAGTTSIAVFEEGDLQHLAVLPVGSQNITDDLAVGLRCEHDAAERIKTEFGALLGPKGKRQERLEVADGEELVFTTKLVSHIIEARVKEIFELVSKELKVVEKQGDLPGGVVLCGGGAKLPKIAEFAKKELKLPVRVGSFEAGTLLEKDPSFLTVLGLLVEAAEDENRVREPKRTLPGAGWLKRLFQSLIP